MTYEKLTEICAAIELPDIVTELKTCHCSDETSEGFAPDMWTVEVSYRTLGCRFEGKDLAAIEAQIRDAIPTEFYFGWVGTSWAGVSLKVDSYVVRRRRGFTWK